MADVAAGRRARRARGPVLGRLRRGLRRAEPARGAGVRDVPRCRRRARSPSSARRSRAPATRPGGWATSTSSRCWPGEHRDAEPLRDGRADDRHGLPALLQHDRQRVRPARRVVPDPAPLAVPLGAARGGRLRARRPTGCAERSVTYHDSCYLTRYNGVIDVAARGPGRRCPASSCARWRTAAADVLLRRRRRADVDGGDAAARGSTRRARSRSLETGATTVATACPFCMDDAARRAQRRGPGRAARTPRRTSASCSRRRRCEDPGRCRSVDRCRWCRRVPRSRRRSGASGWTARRRC